MIMQLDTLACQAVVQKIEHAVSQQPGGKQYESFVYCEPKSKQTLDPDEVHPEQLYAVVEKIQVCEVNPTKVKRA